MVDLKFVINTLNPNSKDKSIAPKGEISPNMTKLGIHVKISGNGNAFNKQKVWDREEQGNNGRNNRKSNKKEEYKDPMVCVCVNLAFTMLGLCHDGVSTHRPVLPVLLGTTVNKD